MARDSSPIKVQRWVERLERFSQSGQTVVEFCRDERVSQSSFYQWKKKLDPRARPTRSHAKSSRSAFRAVEVTSPVLSATTVRLEGGIEIQLGDDLRVVEAVVQQVLELSAAASARSGGRSC